jgi:hypothetical protein
MQRTRIVPGLVVLLALTAFSTPGLPNPVECQKNEPAPGGQSGCDDCKDLWPTGYTYTPTTYYSATCEMQTYPVDQECTDDTTEHGVVCFTTTGQCNLSGSTMKLWFDRNCSQGPPQVLSSTCYPQWFGYRAASWQDQGDVPDCTNP